MSYFMKCHYNQFINNNNNNNNKLIIIIVIVLWRSVIWHSREHWLRLCAAGADVAADGRRPNSGCYSQHRETTRGRQARQAISDVLNYFCFIPWTLQQKFYISHHETSITDGQWLSDHQVAAPCSGAQGEGEVCCGWHHLLIGIMIDIVAAIVHWLRQLTVTHVT